MNNPNFFIAALVISRVMAETPMPHVVNDAPATAELHPGARTVSTVTLTAAHRERCLLLVR